MQVENCPNCGGTHFGDYECPFIKAPCVICGDETILACSDCAINSGGEQSVHVCKRSECRDAHERAVHRSVEAAGSRPNDLAAPPHDKGESK